MSDRDHNDNTPPVVFSLIDFNRLPPTTQSFSSTTTDNNNNIHHNLLKTKLRNFVKCIPFSMEFTELQQSIIKPMQDPFQYPSDVKISYSHQCICVADDAHRRVAFFHLETHHYISSFDTGELNCLFIEENYDGQRNDALYLGEGGTTYKYKLLDLLKNDATAGSSTTTVIEPVWKLVRKHRFGMAMRVVNGRKQLFRFCPYDQQMDVIDPHNGKIEQSITLEGVSRVLDIVFITPYKMILTELDTNTCLIFEQVLQQTTNNLSNNDSNDSNDSNNRLMEWKLVKSIDSPLSIPFSQPLGMDIDRMGAKLFLSDYGNRRIVVFDLEGNVFQTFESSSSSTELNPFGLYFDYKTGLLYVADQQDHSIRIFK